MSKSIREEAMAAAKEVFPGMHWTADGENVVEGRFDPGWPLANLVLYRTLADFGRDGRKFWWECGSLSDSYGNTQGVSAKAAALEMRRMWGEQAAQKMQALYGKVKT